MPALCNSERNPEKVNKPLSSSKYAWLSNAVLDTRSNLGMGTPEESDPDRLEAYKETIRAFIRGEPLTAERIPKMVYTAGKPKKDGSWRDLTDFGLWLISDRYADVFREFEMGLGGLYPIDVMWEDQVTPVDGDYFIFSAGSKKDALIVEKSKGLSRCYDPLDADLKLSLAGNDHVVLNEAALDGPDVWTDTSLARCFFFSDRLVRAMKKAKIATKFRLFRCPIEHI